MKHVAKNSASLVLDIVAKKEKSIKIGYIHFHHIYSTCLKKMQYSGLMVNESLTSKCQSFT